MINNFKGIWRIFISIIITMFTGSILMVIYREGHLEFYNFWLGGAISSPLGFMLGLGWQLSKSSRRNMRFALPIMSLGFLTFGLGSFAFFVELPSMQLKRNILQDFRQIHALNIKSIAIYHNGFGDEKIVELYDRENIDDFVLACKDVKEYYPSHDRPSSEWFLELNGYSWQQLRFYTEVGYPERIIGNFIIKEGKSSFSYGHFSSKELRDWFDNILTKQNENQQ